MSIFRDFFVKEKPVFTGITRGIGGFGFGKSAGGGGGFSVSGGNVDGYVAGNGWTYHTFTSSGSLVISGAAAAKNAEFLIVAGGGGGGVANDNGSDGGGGAGAGNVNSYSNFTTDDLGDGTFNVVVGAGGDPTPGPPSPGSTVQSYQLGSDSTVTKSGPNATLTAKGGGGGAHGPLAGPLGPYGTGGSGGGGGGGGGAADPHYGPAITNTPQPLLPGATITQRGNIGSRGNNPPYYGGGGGGAGGAGVAGNIPTNRGRGGAAAQVTGYTGSDINISALNPLNGYYGGGGPGGSGGPGNNPAVEAPPNGATPGSPASNGPRVGGSAQANTGGGGGGASGAPAPPNPAGASGAGGSGIVVFRYQA
jgi:hypothetical protein